MIQELYENYTYISDKRWLTLLGKLKSDRKMASVPLHK